MTTSIEKANLAAAGAGDAARGSVIDAGVGVTHSMRHEVAKTGCNALLRALL